MKTTFPTLLLALSLSASAAPPEPIEDFLYQHCYDCHDDTTQKGDLDLTSLNYDFSNLSNFSRWVDVLDRIESGEMPPKKKEQPGADEKKAFLDLLSKQLTKEASQHNENGRTELRRLSRVEFANSLKDILDLPHAELKDMLPPDGRAHGFKKSADALDFSHVMIDRYLEVADHALWKALAPRQKGRKSKVIRAELKGPDATKNVLQTLFVQIKHGTGIPLNGHEVDSTMKISRGNFATRTPGFVEDLEPQFDGVATFLGGEANHNIVVKPFRVEQSGYYKLRVNGWSLINDHGKLLPGEVPGTVAFYSPTGRLLGRCDLPPDTPTTSEVTVWLNEGEPVEYLAISNLVQQWHLPAGKLKPYVFHHFKAHGIALRWFEMEGPLNEQWPPESHKILLGNLPLEESKSENSKLPYRVVTNDPQADARRLLRGFAARALRRPLKDGDLAIPLAQTNARLRRGDTFINALFAGYRAILVSPEFLLLEEKPGKLDAWALASRLSFFLTNSPPDHLLRRAAADGSLLKDDELRKHTERLLKHQNKHRFVEHFLGGWLDLHHIDLTQPDENLYPDFNPFLSESLVEETHAFFTEMLQNNLGILNIIDSDFLTINQRVAELYNINDVQGSHIRKVSRPSDSPRGGLLTQGSLLKITANGTTTSPVVRGTFVLDRLLGDPPPPPPSAVPAIEPDISGAVTIRDQLAKHREDPACASCHRKIDPPGFALESFDVMGGFRDHYRATLQAGEQGIKKRFNGKPARFKHGLSVDSSGNLDTGEAFSNISEFRHLLSSRERDLAHNLLERLIVYSTGAPVSFADRAEVSEILDRLEADSFGLRSMIHEIVQSQLFRHK